MNWPAISGAFACVLVAFVSVTAVIVAILDERDERAERCKRREIDERDAQLGRELRDVTGSDREARFAIEEARLNAALCRKFGAEFLKATGQTAPLKPSNVVRLDIRRGGRVINFTPDGDAA